MKTTWHETTLGKLVDFQSGGTPSKGNPDFWNGSIPWGSAKDMKQLFLDDTEDHITTAAADDGAKQVPSGTMLMLTRGMTLLNDVPICILRRSMSFNQDVKALRPKGDLDSRFLPYLLLGNKHRLLSMVDLTGHGTGRLNTEELKTLEVSLPPPPRAAGHRLHSRHAGRQDRVEPAAEPDAGGACKGDLPELVRRFRPSSTEE
jgi:type I restriction enzyme S subunit